MTVQAYGCIPFMRKRDRGVVALMILRTGGFWEFPKGKQEQGESEQDTARRELKEETGLSGELAEEDPISISYQFERDGETIEKQVTYYFCRVPDGSSVTLDAREVNDYRWLSLEDLPDRATYPEMKEVARAALLALAD